MTLNKSELRTLFINEAKKQGVKVTDKSFDKLYEGLEMEIRKPRAARAPGNSRRSLKDAPFDVQEEYFNTHCPVAPSIISSRVIGDIERWAGTELPDAQALESYCTERAIKLFFNNDEVYKKLMGNSGREYMYAYAAHWIGSKLKGSINGKKLPYEFIWQGKPLPEAPVVENLQEGYHLGDSQFEKEPTQVGLYTTLEKTDDGNLKIMLSKTGKRYLKENNLAESSNGILELIKEHEGWRVVKPSEIGQETTAPIISDKFYHTKDGIGYDKVYWNPDTTVNETEVLLKQGYIVLHGVEGED